MLKEVIDQMQFLSFYLDGELYAIVIDRVREVLDYNKIRSVPRMPDFMKGVINLRGAVVPIMDLRIKFNMPIAENTVNTCIIIVELPIDGEDVFIGIIADSVQEVLTLNTKSIEQAPRLGTKLHTDFIDGMCKRGEEFIILLNLVKIFTQEELIAVHPEKELIEEVEQEEKQEVYQV